MRKMIYVYISVVTFLLVLSIASIYFILSTRGGKGGLVATSETVENLEDCNVVKYSGENAINFVFFSSEDEARSYSNYLMSVKPFDEYADNFNVFNIDNYDAECNLYKKIALLCYSNDLLRKASSCPVDYIVVLEERASSIRSSAYMNVMSLNSVHPFTVYLHEFGHVFANLAEEYVDNAAKIPKSAKNCVDECSKFQSEIDGCYQGCTKSSYFRSVENGIMRTLSPPKGVFYGLFNENTLKERISEEVEESLIFTGNVIGTGRAIQNQDVSCKGKSYLSIEVARGDDGLEIVDERLLPGCAGGQGFGDLYQYRLKDKGGVILERGFDPVRFYAEGPAGDGSGDIVSDLLEPPETFIIQAPIADEIVSVEVEDEVGRVIEISLENVGARPCEI